MISSKSVSAISTFARSSYFNCIPSFSTASLNDSLRCSLLPPTPDRTTRSGRLVVVPILSCTRHFSTPSAPIHPPSDLNEEIISSVHSSTEMIIRYGVGKSRLASIQQLEKGVNNIVPRWQSMMEVFLGAQVHVLIGLGYSADERGLSAYQQQLSVLLQTASPAVQEYHRTASRDLWRYIVRTAFEVEDIHKEERSIQDARDMMFKVSSAIGEPRILEEVARRCANEAPGKDDIQKKHNVVQEVLVKDVYLYGSPTLVSTLGFGEGEEGYVRLQCSLAEHQNDPLIQQYMGTAMSRLLYAAGVDMPGMMKVNDGATERPS